MDGAVSGVAGLSTPDLAEAPRAKAGRAYLMGRFTTFVCLILLTATGYGQFKPQPVAELPDHATFALMLRKLASTGTFMETTAHPDDEDNALLARLGLGEGMRTVLVSATRGNGGQNEIGPELFEALGVLRTEELLAVHRFDGAEQYFTRAIDFGFSFSVEESIEKWGHDETLADFVRHIRTVRPDVIAGFLCGGEGGGQHHQAAARLTTEAFRAAADPARYPDQIKEGLRPFQARRVFCTDETSFSPSRPNTNATDEVAADVSGFDPVLGRTYSYIGIEARSMHKCQGTSQLLPLPGQTFNRIYKLRDSVLDRRDGTSFTAPRTMFDGIDTSIPGLARFAKNPTPALAGVLQQIDAAVKEAGTSFRASGPPAAAPALITGFNLVTRARATLNTLGLDDEGMYEIGLRLDQKARQFEDALAIAHGIRLEALADDGTVTVGQPVKMSLTVGAAQPVTVTRVTVKGFSGADVACSGTADANAVVTCAAQGTIAEAPLSTPYWTPRRDAARYDFEAGVPFGVAFRPTPFLAQFTLRIRDTTITLTRPVEFRYSDIVAGEKRTELHVVPAFNVRMSPEIVVVPQRATTGRGRDVRVAVGNNRKGRATATVALNAPAGWQISPEKVAVTFSREDEEATARFTVTPPANTAAGEYAITASADGVTLGYDVIEYPHTRRRHMVMPATTRAKVIDVTVPDNLRVGYIVGVGDQVPQAIAQLGATLQFIDAEELSSGDLSRYDVIVTGVRAYERRPDLRANNQRLLRYAEQGGTVIVQYNKFEFNEAQYGPYPAKVSSNRVTDENAPIEVLVPDHPVFTSPNKVDANTWRGWVQERGLYFLGERDPRYVDLLRSTDPFPFNAGAKTGALVEARVGKGRWIYLGLGLWRQLPSGTDGAYRVMANLLALGAQSR